MKKKGPKCYLCGGNITFNEITQTFICTECKATHNSDMLNIDVKNKKNRIRLTKIRILVAILAALYALYFFYRRIS
ncbi:MAG: hypothetical protein EU540_03720 [Promethearchaeota archaeon]|nr:MAG: hypothetical protein EU540_03720 [Candidatus Lokiarchaeota archaeon]